MIIPQLNYLGTLIIYPDIHVLRRGHNIFLEEGIPHILLMLHGLLMTISYLAVEVKIIVFSNGESIN